MESETFDGLREAALSNLWFPFQQLNDVAAEGGLQIMTEGKGAKIKDIHGKEYYDGFAGLALVNVGYGREEIARAVYEQMSTLHYANTFAYATIPTIKAAEKLASLAPGDLNRVFFTSGGSDSVETSMKMARQYHFNRGEKERVKFISRRGSYHGVSLGALAVNMAPLGEPGDLPAHAAYSEGCAPALAVPVRAGRRDGVRVRRAVRRGG